MNALYRAFLFLFLLTYGLVLPVFSENAQDTIAYKLAILHARDQFPEKLLMEGKVNPTNADVSDFKWIMDSLKIRCINPETAIADTLVETWQILQNQNKDITLLQVSRELWRFAEDKSKFGSEKVNLRMINRYWLVEKYPELFKNQ